MSRQNLLAAGNHKHKPSRHAAWQWTWVIRGAGNTPPQLRVRLRRVVAACWVQGVCVQKWAGVSVQKWASGCLQKGLLQNDAALVCLITGWELHASAQ